LDDRDTLWSVNFDRFNQEFRNRAIQNYVTEKVNPVAGRIVGTVLSLTTLSQRSKADNDTIPVGVDRLLTTVNGSSEERKVCTTTYV
jgi:hypothetical protein